MYSHAPILIITLNRYEHLKRCIESLSACRDSENADLFIALDYPLNESHWEGYKQIENYLTTIKGFKSIYIIKRDINLGSSNNFFDALKTIFAKYDKLIFTEDDIVFSPNFLDYTNKGLNLFKDDPNIFAICGYNYPIRMPADYDGNFYKWKGFSAWGCGIWKDKFEKVCFKTERITEFLSRPWNVIKLVKYADHYLPALLDISKTNHITVDTVICMHLIKNNMNCIFPINSKTRNCGYDGSGEHCKVILYDKYSTQIIDTCCTFEFSKSLQMQNENNGINKVLKKHFKAKYLSHLYIYYTYFHYIIKHHFSKTFK